MMAERVIRDIAAMDEWQRLRLWWHWMIDRAGSSASWHPSLRNRIHDKVSLDEFFTTDPWGHVNGPEWTAAHSYYQREWNV